MMTAQRGPRPVPVTVASVLTFVGIPLAFVSTLLRWKGLDAMTDYLVGDMADDYPSVVWEAKAENARDAVVFFLVDLAAGVGAAVSAIFVLRGAIAARVTLCVLAGLFVACRLALMAIHELWFAHIAGDSDLIGLIWGLAAVDLLLVGLAVGILVCLLLRSASEYFRPSAEAPGAQSTASATYR